MVRFCAARPRDRRRRDLPHDGTSISSDFGDGAVLLRPRDRRLHARALHDLRATPPRARSRSPVVGLGATRSRTARSPTGSASRTRHGAPLMFRAGRRRRRHVGRLRQRRRLGNAEQHLPRSCRLHGGPTNGHGLSEGQRVIYQVSDPPARRRTSERRHLLRARRRRLDDPARDARYCNAVAKPLRLELREPHARVLIAHRPARRDTRPAHARASARPRSAGARSTASRTSCTASTDRTSRCARRSAPGVDISLDKTDGLGHTRHRRRLLRATQALFKAGSALHTASGNQQIYVRLDRLAAEHRPSSCSTSDGSSLRAARAAERRRRDERVRRAAAAAASATSPSRGATTNINPDGEGVRRGDRP